MAARRVAVTGLGMISAIGNDIPETWASVCAGKSGIGPIHSIDVTKLRFKNGAQITGYNPAEHFEANRILFLDPFSQFAVIAAREVRACG